jgi:hypothetical protein
MPTCPNQECNRKFVGKACPYCNSTKTKKRTRLNESAFGSSKQEYANIDDLQPTTTIEVHGNYVQNIDNSSKHEIQVGGDYLEKSAIKATDSTILSKSTNSPPELSETER